MKIYNVLWKIDIALCSNRGRLFNYIKQTAQIKHNILESGWYISENTLEDFDIPEVSDIIIVFKEKYDDKKEKIDSTGITALEQYIIFFGEDHIDFAKQARKKGYNHAYIININSIGYTYIDLNNHKLR